MARIRFFWIQELPPDQAGQEEAVNSHGHHLGKMPGDTPEEPELPASPCSSSPHSSKELLALQPFESPGLGCVGIGLGCARLLLRFLQEDAFPPQPFGRSLHC